jgi:hypothetical protein
MSWLLKNIAIAIGMWVLRRVARALMNRRATRRTAATGGRSGKTA